MSAPIPPIPAFPTRPGQVPAAAVVDELLGAYHRHLFLAVTARAADDHDARHALAALAIGQAIVDTFAAERWPLVRDVLEGGASAAEPLWFTPERMAEIDLEDAASIGEAIRRAAAESPAFASMLRNAIERQKADDDA